jgi:ABC-2 type transport system ATP-binding protein
MRTRLLAAFAAAAMSVTLLAVPSTAAAAHSQRDVCVRSVPETDPLEAGPTSICFTVFKPRTASAENKVPVVLHSHGWAGSRTKSMSSFSDYLDEGMAVVSIDQRGHGESGGKAHVEDPAFEGEDMIRVIDYIAGLRWVAKDGPKDPVLGAIGGSYGGGYQFVAAFTEIMKTGRTRLNALAPEITWYSLNESLAPRGVVRTAWVAALYGAGANQHTSQVHAGFAEGSATGNWPDSMDEFFHNNGPKWHVQHGRKLTIPVLFGQGASDNLFPLDQGLKNFRHALTDRARKRSIFVGYNGGHALPSAMPPGYASGGDACSATLGGGDKDITSFGDLARQFLAEKLNNAPRQVTGYGRYHLTTAEGKCVTVSRVGPTTTYKVGNITTPTTAGPPQAIKLADGPLRIAGTPYLEALVTGLGLQNRAFFALSVGTSPSDAKVIQNNTLPHSEPSLNLGTQRRIELPSVAARVAKGQSLFLTVSPVADMFGGHGSRTPGAMLLENAKVRVPVR